MKAICFLLVLFSTISFSQTNNSLQSDNSSELVIENSEYPMHSIDLRITYWNNSKSGTSVIVPGVKIATGGISGKLMYNFYFNQQYAFNVSIGVMEVNVNAWALNEYTSSVAPIMMGMKYYFIPISKKIPLRPYVTGSIGMLVGSESSMKLFSVREHTESAVGAYAGVGTDIILGSLIKLHAEVGYNLFTDFSEDIGCRDNYSGAEFSMGLGFMF